MTHKTSTMTSTSPTWIRLLVPARDVPAGGLISHPLFPSQAKGQLEKTYKVASWDSDEVVTHTAQEHQLFFIREDAAPTEASLNFEVLWVAHPTDAALYLATLGSNKRRVCNPLYRVAYVIFKGSTEWAEDRLCDHSTLAKPTCYVVYQPEVPKAFSVRRLDTGLEVGAYHTKEEASHRVDAEQANAILAEVIKLGHQVYWQREDAKVAALLLTKQRKDKS